MTCSWGHNVVSFVSSQHYVCSLMTLLLLNKSLDVICGGSSVQPTANKWSYADKAICPAIGFSANKLNIADSGGLLADRTFECQLCWPCCPCNAFCCSVHIYCVAISLCSSMMMYLRLDSVYRLQGQVMICECSRWCSLSMLQQIISQKRANMQCKLVTASTLQMHVTLSFVQYKLQNSFQSNWLECQTSHMIHDCCRIASNQKKLAPGPQQVTTS